MTTDGIYEGKLVLYPMMCGLDLDLFDRNIFQGQGGAERKKEEGQRTTNRICGLMHLSDSQTSAYH